MINLHERMLPISMGLSIQEKKLKIDFQDGNCGGHLVFLIRAILAIFDLQVTLMILTKFQVNWTSGSGKEAKNRFSTWPPWWPSWMSYQNDFSCFDLPVTPMLSTKFQINWLSVHQKKLKINGGHLGFPIRTIFFLSIFDLKFTPKLGNPIGTILAIFDLQVTPMLPAKFQVNKLFGSREEAKNRFSRCPPWRPSWISNQKDCSCF